jgi:hypothetical protein
MARSRRLQLAPQRQRAPPVGDALLSGANYIRRMMSIVQSMYSCVPLVLH